MLLKLWEVTHPGASNCVRYVRSARFRRLICKIKINEYKSVQVTFLLRNLNLPPIMLNKLIISTENGVKYFDITLT